MILHEYMHIFHFYIFTETSPISVHDHNE